MKATFLSREGDDFVIKVDLPLMNAISASYVRDLKSGQDISLHDYIPNAQRLSQQLEAFRAAIATIVSITTKGD